MLPTVPATIAAMLWTLQKIQSELGWKPEIFAGRRHPPDHRLVSGQWQVAFGRARRRIPFVLREILRRSRQCTKRNRRFQFEAACLEAIRAAFCADATNRTPPAMHL